MMTPCRVAALAVQRPLTARPERDAGCEQNREDEYCPERCARAACSAEMPSKPISVAVSNPRSNRKHPAASLPSPLATTPEHYGWAFVNPVRKLWYDLTITAAMVVVALFIGGIEALAVISHKLELEGGLWAFGALGGSLNDNLTNFGFIVVGIFVASWLVSSIVYRLKGYDRLQLD